MICQKCGAEHNNNFCPNCGTRADGTPMHEDVVRCPHCGSAQLSVGKRGFKAGRAIGWGLLTGGIGLVTGAIGANKTKVTCLKCGHSWIIGDK